MNKDEIAALEKSHAEAPHERIMQKALARDVTTRVHSAEECQKAVDASDFLFGKGTTEALKSLSEGDFLAMFDGVPQSQISMDDLTAGISVIDLVAEKSKLFPSKGEARRMISQGGLFVNKVKVDDPMMVINSEMLLNNKYLLFQKGKKSYFIVHTV
jgi:tyrosyl-tRNA synthetase